MRHRTTSVALGSLSCSGGVLCQRKGLRFALGLPSCSLASTDKRRDRSVSLGPARSSRQDARDGRLVALVRRQRRGARSRGGERALLPRLSSPRVVVARPGLSWSSGERPLPLPETAVTCGDGFLPLTLIDGVLFTRRPCVDDEVVLEIARFRRRQNLP